MSRGNCSQEQREQCPIMQLGRDCYTDIHHLQYPANRHRSGVEKAWRDQPFNKVQICRALHNAIHASGYIPEKPDKQTMVGKVWNNSAENPPLRAMVERELQIQIGRQMLLNGPHPPAQEAVA